MRLGDRPNLDIERQFLKLDASDMEYLRAKGMLAWQLQAEMNQLSRVNRPPFRCI